MRPKAKRPGGLPARDLERAPAPLPRGDESHLTYGWVYQWLSAITPLTISNIRITHIKKTGGPSGIT
jgi:hypothetical protein